MATRKKASKSRTKSAQKAAKSRTASRTRPAVTKERVEDVDGCDCDFSEDVTLDQELPAAKGAVELLRSSRRPTGRGRSARA